MAARPLREGALGVVDPVHRETLRQALDACFGRAAVDGLVPLAVGASAGAILRVDSGGRRYLLRIEGPRSPLRYPHQYEALRMAAEAGVAPPVFHVDEAAGVAVTGFIESWPLRTYPGGPVALVRAVGQLLRRLHDSPPVPVFVPYPEIVARLFAHVRRTGLFAAGLLDPHWERLERLRAAYDSDPADAVSCHNDSLPSNLLFDGERLWLVDWESAYPNDPLVDIAIQLDNTARSPALAEALLHAWLGRAPDRAVSHRLEQARALNRLYYAGVLLSASADRAPTAHALGKLYLHGFLTGEPVPPMPQ
ncbi:MAG TPA: phosphotransferase [Reyranella sp.]|nr:phosphotransferase [Reyranella sp.]